MIAANLFPIIGVLFFDWEVYEIVVLYIFETVVAGTFNVAKMGLINDSQKTFTIFFFIFHYNFFILIQSVFVIVLIGGHSSNSDSPHFGQAISGLIDIFKSRDFIFSVLLIIISHSFNFYNDYLKPEKYKNIKINKQMFEPYKRIFVQQFTVIIGAFILMTIDGTMGFLIILVFMKIIVDLFSHKKTSVNSKFIGQK